MISIGVTMSWNVRYNRKLFLNLKFKSELHHVVITTPKTPPKKLTQPLVELKDLPNTEQTDSKKKEISCSKCKDLKVGGKSCVKFRTDGDNFNNVVYRYRNSKDLKQSTLI